MIWKRRTPPRYKRRRPLGHIVDYVTTLPDRRDACYVWTLKPGTSPAQRAAFEETLKAALVHTLGRDPVALHLVREDVRDVHFLSQEEIKGIVEPWAMRRN